MWNPVDSEALSGLYAITMPAKGARWLCGHDRWRRCSLQREAQSLLLNCSAIRWESTVFWRESREQSPMDGKICPLSHFDILRVIGEVHARLCAQSGL